jgi:hypothetical protein
MNHCWMGKFTVSPAEAPRDPFREWLANSADDVVVEDVVLRWGGAMGGDVMAANVSPDADAWTTPCPDEQADLTGPV